MYGRCTVGLASFQNLIRVVNDRIRLVYGWGSARLAIEASARAMTFECKFAPRLRVAVRPRGGIAKIQHSAPACPWVHLGDCQNSAFVPDWYSSRIRSHTHWHARNPVERIAQMEFSVERVAQLGISVERIDQLGISVERAWLRA